MKADKYLESIGLENVIDEEFFNDDDKSWYKVQELMEAYHQSKLDLLTIPVVGVTLPTKYSIAFAGFVAANVEVQGNEIKILDSINGWGNKIPNKSVSVIKK